MAERKHFTWALALTAFTGGTAAQAQSQTPPATPGDDRKVIVRLGEQIAREDNLYRLPSDLDPTLVVGPDASRDDSIRTTSLAVDGHWQQAKQEVVLDALLADNRFAENSDLDYTSGHGALDWNWEFGSRWSGVAEARHEQTLASFANTSALEKDVYATSGYRGEARFDMGARWRLIGGASIAHTTHDAEDRRGDDAQRHDESFEVEMRTPRPSSLGWEYRQSHATYPFGAPGLGGSVSDYDERRGTMKLGYTFSEKLGLTASAGAVTRSYPFASRGDFSGGVWSAALQWSPTAKMQFGLQSSRDLKAYIDAESDHFVSTAIALIAAWKPIQQLGLTARLAHENQTYIGLTEAELLLPQREDEPTTGSVRLSYTPRERASFFLTYAGETRASNRPRFDYDASTASVGFEIKF